MHQIGIDETDDCFGHLGLTGQRFAEPCFDELVVTETAGDGKHHGKDGHNGQQCGIGKRSGKVNHALCSGQFDSHIHTLGHTIEEIAYRGNVFAVYSPQSYAEEMDNLSDFLSHVLFPLVVKVR